MRFHDGSGKQSLTAGTKSKGLAAFSAVGPLRDVKAGIGVNSDGKALLVRTPVHFSNELQQVSVTPADGRD